MFVIFLGSNFPNISILFSETIIIKGVYISLIIELKEDNIFLLFSVIKHKITCSFTIGSIRSLSELMSSIISLIEIFHII